MKERVTFQFRIETRIECENERDQNDRINKNHKHEKSSSLASEEIPSDGFDLVLNKSPEINNFQDIFKNQDASHHVRSSSPDNFRSDMKDEKSEISPVAMKDYSRKDRSKASIEGFQRIGFGI